MLNLDKQAAALIWDTAKSYLAERLSAEILSYYVAGKANPRRTRMPQVYRGLLLSLQNRQGMMNSIGGVAALDAMAPLFDDYDPKAVTVRYAGDWKDLFRTIRRERKPASRMVMSNPRSYWVHFCKGALDGAAVLARFGGLKAFAAFVDKFAGDAIAAPGLPLMLAREIHGLGFALACDFLKEAGWSAYAKPDTHTNAILSGLGIGDGSGYSTFKGIVRLAALVGEEPYTVDKYLWLIGSGWLYDHDQHFATDKAEFVTLTRAKLREAGYSC